MYPVPLSDPESTLDPLASLKVSTMLDDMRPLPKGTDNDLMISIMDPAKPLPERDWWQACTNKASADLDLLDLTGCLDAFRP